jgi:L-aspartate oxidase
MQNTDVLVIGSGIAGATAALVLAKNPDRQVTIITREPDPQESNTRYAQGGIIGRGEDDNPEILARDILAAGAGAASPLAARILAEEGPEILQQLLVDQAGVRFDTRSDGGPEYGMEAAHSCRRVLNAELPQYQDPFQSNGCGPDHLSTSLARSFECLPTGCLPWCICL